MKSTVISQKSTNKTKYPCLQKGRLSGNVYLMINSSSGTLVAVTNESEKDYIGQQYNSLSPENYIPFKGVVQLSSED